MAKGLLGSAVANSTTAVVYTVPAGISRAVVNITIAAIAGINNTTSNYVSLSGSPILTLNAKTTGATQSYSNSVSMMLSAGDVIRVHSTVSGICCTVSGYEVP